MRRENKHSKLLAPIAPSSPLFLIGSAPCRLGPSRTTRRPSRGWGHVNPERPRTEDPARGPRVPERVPCVCGPGTPHADFRTPMCHSSNSGGTRRPGRGPRRFASLLAAARLSISRENWVPSCLRQTVLSRTYGLRWLRCVQPTSCSDGLSYCAPLSRSARLRPCPSASLSLSLPSVSNCSDLSIHVNRSAPGWADPAPPLHPLHSTSVSTSCETHCARVFIFPALIRQSRVQGSRRGPDTGSVQSPARLAGPFAEDVALPIFLLDRSRGSRA